MKTYTLYFKEGDTWTADYISDAAAGAHGLELAASNNLTYSHFERCEPVAHWGFTPDTM